MASKREEEREEMSSWWCRLLMDGLVKHGCCGRGTAGESTGGGGDTIRGRSGGDTAHTSLMEESLEGSHMVESIYGVAGSW